MRLPLSTTSILDRIPVDLIPPSADIPIGGGDIRLNPRLAALFPDVFNSLAMAHQSMGFKVRYSTQHPLPALVLNPGPLHSTCLVLHPDTEPELVADFDGSLPVFRFRILPVGAYHYLVL